MKEFKKTREIDFSWNEVAKGLFRKFENEIHFQELIVDVREVPDGLEIVKVKVPDQKNPPTLMGVRLKEEKCSVSPVRYDLNKKVIGHWERILSPGKSEEDEREFLSYREIAPRKVEYNKYQICSSRWRYWLLKPMDRYGFNLLIKKINEVVQEQRKSS